MPHQQGRPHFSGNDFNFGSNFQLPQFQNFNSGVVKDQFGNNIPSGQNNTLGRTSRDNFSTGSTPNTTQPGFTPGADLNRNDFSFDDFGKGVGLAGSLGQGYLAFKTLEQGQEQFDLDKDSANATLGNEAESLGRRLGNQEYLRLKNKGFSDADAQAGADAVTSGIQTDLSGTSFKFSR